MRPIFTALAVLAATAFATSNAAALMPFTKPDKADVATGVAEPFVGAWSVTIPTMTMGERDTRLAICTLPVRIEALGEAQIIYRQPREIRTGSSFDLSKQDDGTIWSPTDSDQRYFAFWVNRDGFFLYDEVPKADADWGRPMIYNRCPQP